MNLASNVAASVQGINCHSHGFIRHGRYFWNDHQTAHDFHGVDSSCSIAVNASCIAVCFSGVKLFVFAVCCCSIFANHGLSFCILAICSVCNCWSDSWFTVAFISTPAIPATCCAYLGHSPVHTHLASILPTVLLPYVWVISILCAANQSSIVGNVT